jgi:hypothetical protein
MTFYVDSGAGQCLCSCSSAFLTMEACHFQVVGVAGRLTIHGQGTTIFLVSVEGNEAILRIHNCLHSFGEFNLISVSQLKLVPGNSLDFSVQNPFLHFSRGQTPSSDFGFPTNLAVPFFIDEGLYSVFFEPVTPSDPWYGELPIFDVTPSGAFSPMTQMLSAVPRRDGDPEFPIWTTEVLSIPPRKGRVIALPAATTMDFDEELKSFSDAFLAPAAIPSTRRQYDTGKSIDMTELSIRFMGAGTDRLYHTVEISN